MTDLEILHNMKLEADELDGSIDVSGSVVINDEDEVENMIDKLEENEYDELIEYLSHDDPAISNLAEMFGMNLDGLNADVETDETGSVISIDTHESEDETEDNSNETSSYKVTEYLE
jgi:hypothetical protein